jgi:putative DNA primase/helicase
MREYPLDEIREALSYLDYDDRETWVRAALMLKSSLGEDGFAMWDDWSANYSRYDPKAARNVWKSAKAGKLTVGSLIHEAKAKGWQPGARKIDTAADIAERDHRRAARAALLAQEEADRAAYHNVVADHCAAVWDLLAPTGSSKYLGTKKVGAFGIRFGRESFLSVIHKDRIAAEIIRDRAAVKEFLDHINAIPYEERTVSFRHIRKGCIAVPLRDVGGHICNLQLIWPAGAKTFFYNGKKSGCFHLIGEPNPRAPLVIVEGYATGASVHMATQYPVAVAIDAGNLMPVAKALRGLMPDIELIIAADNDAETPGNPGIAKGRETALAFDVKWCFPEFHDGQVGTDFNDMLVNAIAA